MFQDRYLLQYSGIIYRLIFNLNEIIWIFLENVIFFDRRNNRWRSFKRIFLLLFWSIWPSNKTFKCDPRHISFCFLLDSRGIGNTVDTGSDWFVFKARIPCERGLNPRRAKCFIQQGKVLHPNRTGHFW